MADETTPAPGFTPGDIHPKSPLSGHRLANKFPMMKGADMAAHMASVKEHGQFDPIVMHEGLVLDGRNTLFACLELGFDPRFRNFGDKDDDGEFPAAYVAAHNLTRRHLSPGQRAAAATEFVPEFEREAAERMKAGQFKAPAPEVVAAEGTKTEAVPGTLPAPIESSEAAPAPGVVIQPEEPPAPGSTETGTAVSKAAQKAGATVTGTKVALRLKKKYPDLFEALANGDMNLHAAEAEEKKRDAEKEEKVSAATKRTERINAIKALEKRHGENSAFVEAVKEKRVLKNHGDLLEYADMKRKEAFTVLPLVKIGWSPKKAKAYIDAAATADSTVAELLAMAILKAGDVPRNQEIRRVFVVDLGKDGKITLELHREGVEEETATALAASSEPQFEPEPQPENAPTIEAEAETLPQAEEHAEPEPQAADEGDAARIEAEEAQRAAEGESQEQPEDEELNARAEATEGEAKGEN